MEFLTRLLLAFSLLRQGSIPSSGFSVDLCSLRMLPILIRASFSSLGLGLNTDAVNDSFPHPNCPPNFLLMCLRKLISEYIHHNLGSRNWLPSLTPTDTFLLMPKKALQVFLFPILHIPILLSNLLFSYLLII